MPPWPPGQPPQQTLTTTSLMPQGWVQAPPPGQVLQVVHQLAPPGVGSPAQGPPPALPPPPQQPQQQQYWPMVINQQGLPPSVQLTPGGQIVAPPPMSQPMPQPSPPCQQPPQMVGQTPYSMGQVYNIHYVSASTTTSSVSPSVTTTPTSGSQTPSHSAPSQPVKRRFTEEKPQMTDNENLLGYQVSWWLHLVVMVSHVCATNGCTDMTHHVVWSMCHMSLTVFFSRWYHYQISFPSTHGGHQIVTYCCTIGLYDPTSWTCYMRTHVW